MIRAATHADYATFAMLVRDLGSDDPAPSRDRWTTDLARATLLHERAGRVDGCVTFTMIGATGHVRNVVVAPAARRTGVGVELMQAAADAMRARGGLDWQLDVKRDNAPAIQLLERFGLRVEHRSTVLRLPWTLALASEPATALAVAPDDDDDIERALGLLAGRIAMGRMRARVLVQLRDAQCAPVGYATFDREVGASPFRVARPGLAGTLLAALRPHATTEHVSLVIEDDAALAELLAAAGAERRLELLHYRGLLGSGGSVGPGGAGGCTNSRSGGSGRSGTT